MYAETCYKAQCALRTAATRPSLCVSNAESVQVVRDPLLELVTHMVVAKGSMADACMQLLVSSLYVVKSPDAAEDLVPGMGWVPSAEELLIQDDIIACLRKVSTSLLLLPQQRERLSCACNDHAAPPWSWAVQVSSIIPFG